MLPPVDNVIHGKPFCIQCTAVILSFKKYCLQVLLYISLSCCDAEQQVGLLKQQSECHRLTPVSAANWFNKGHDMCYHVHVIMRVKDP